MPWRASSLRAERHGAFVNHGNFQGTCSFECREGQSHPRLAGRSNKRWEEEFWRTNHDSSPLGHDISPDLVHAGASSESQNFRLHLFLDLDVDDYQDDPARIQLVDRSFFRMKMS